MEIKNANKSFFPFRSRLFSIRWIRAEKDASAKETAKNVFLPVFLIRMLPLPVPTFAR